MTKRKHYKVVIIGAGPGGSSCAIALANLGIKDILIVEAGGFDKFRIGESIPPESRTVLLKLGVYDNFLNEGHEPCYGSCSYWGDERRGYNDFLLSPYGHGWHIDRRRFNLFLSGQAEVRGVELVSNYEFINSSQTDKREFNLTLRDAQGKESSIIADFIVDASGARSVFALQQGSKKINNTPLICLAARFNIDNNSNIIPRLTHLEAVEYGWWYAARLPGNLLLAALYTDAGTIKQYGLRKLSVWKDLLSKTKNTGKLTAGIDIVDKKLMAFPAPSFILNKTVGNNWLAIGDAASTYDPLMSQGIMKSITDALFAAQTIAKYFSGSADKLKEYHYVIATNYKQYLYTRKYFYHLEKRWPESSFWKTYQGRKESPPIQQKKSIKTSR